MNRFFRYHLDHILFWTLTLGFHAYTRLYLIEQTSMFQFVLEIFVRNVLLAGVIYFNLLVVIPRLGQQKIVWILASLCSMGLYVLAKGWHDRYVMGIGDAEHAGIYHNAFYNFSIVLFYQAFAAALYLSKEWYMQREMLRQVLVEKLNTELDYLKAQMNPHFLFNSINTIFFQIDKQNHEARETLGKFSDMLRYQLYECNGDRIAIEKELSYLKSYVELQRLRRNGHDVIRFETEGALNDFQLPPMLLIPFVENAFKHVSNYSHRENEVRITLKRSNGALTLAIANTVDTNMSLASGGIGLRNVKRRLELLFPNQHALDVRKTNDWFEVNLTLQVK
ncbi:sensor histidine kinase [Chryseolinea lacunae]|uniref:Histidine kinase n=1 Tax=Chryseolinea lacunae TaxID=2801331 RepID=A0ABS1L1G6_9BACT|nr:histidine kinase [Chryseolinea lacunae]MBL0745539.1 histidine kinase [Chryseolinea lacunae]